VSYSLDPNTHSCDAVIDDGGEWVPCRRTDTRSEGVAGWFCPEHTEVAS
jgi:hypothetical protein